MKRRLAVLVGIGIACLVPLQLLALVGVWRPPETCFLPAPVDPPRWDFDGDGSHDRVEAIRAGDGGTVAVLVNSDPQPAIPENPAGTYDVLDWAVADLDVDGDLDVTAIGRFRVLTKPGRGTRGRVSFLLNDGRGRFSGSDLAVDYEPRGLEVGDLDGDRLPDVVIEVGGGDRYVVWNRGAGAPGPSQSVVGHGRLYGLEVVDIDGDGDLDVLTNVQSEDARAQWHIGIARNQGSRLFGPFELVPTDGADGLGISSGDLDDDGDPDVAVAGGRNVTVLLNSGGRLGRLRTYRTGASEAVDVMVGDVDGDGANDLAVVHGPVFEDGHAGNEGTRVLYNRGGGKFSQPVRLLAPGTWIEPDLNADGRLDASREGTTYVSSRRVAGTHVDADDRRHAEDRSRGASGSPWR